MPWRWLPRWWRRVIGQKFQSLTSRQMSNLGGRTFHLTLPYKNNCNFLKNCPIFKMKCVSETREQVLNVYLSYLQICIWQSRQNRDGAIWKIRRFFSFWITSCVMPRARDVISRASSRAPMTEGLSGRARSHEYAKFQIFQIGPLLAEIWPILWNDNFF